MVSRLSTIESRVEPEIRLANSQPTVLKKGLSATRTGYFQITFASVIPFERAVST